MTSTLPPLVQAVSGALGSAAANGLVYPLDLIATRVQLESPGQNVRKGGIQDPIRMLRQIVQKKGLKALYDGLSTDTGATVISNFFYFYLYSYLRDFILRRHLPAASKSGKKMLPKLSMLEDLAVGFLAGVASRAISTPLSLVTLRLQTENPEDNDDKKKAKNDPTGVTTVVRRIYEEDGLVGFWRGFASSIFLCLNPSITMAFFQLFRRAIHIARIRRGVSASTTSVLPDPNPREAFIGAAVSNSIAVSLLYPLILAKTRVQAWRQSHSDSYAQPPTILSALFDAYTRPIPTSDNHSPPTYAAVASPNPATAKHAGLPALYQGLETQILKGFLSQGVTFLVKGRIEQIIVWMYLRRLRAVA